jgi:DNA-binding transcriptional LysR family regulator
LLDRHQVDLVLGGRPEPGWDVRVLAVRPHQLVVVAAPALAASAAGNLRAAGTSSARGNGSAVGSSAPGSSAPGSSAPGSSAPGSSAADPAGDQLLPWLARQAWLLREPGSGTRASTGALLAELDIAPLTLMVGSNGAIRESATVGLGVTLISRDAVAAELASGRLVELPVPGTPLHRDWYLVAHPETLPPAAERLVAHVLSYGGFRLPPDS